MINPIFSFVIYAKKGKDSIGAATKVFSCTNIEDAKKVAVEIATSRWPLVDGWTEHTAIEIND